MTIPDAAGPDTPLINFIDPCAVQQPSFSGYLKVALYFTIVRSIGKVVVGFMHHTLMTFPHAMPIYGRVISVSEDGIRTASWCPREILLSNKPPPWSRASWITTPSTSSAFVRVCTIVVIGIGAELVVAVGIVVTEISLCSRRLNINRETSKDARLVIVSATFLRSSS